MLLIYRKLEAIQVSITKQKTCRPDPWTRDSRILTRIPDSKTWIDSKALLPLTKTLKLIIHTRIGSRGTQAVLPILEKINKYYHHQRCHDKSPLDPTRTSSKTRTVLVNRTKQVVAIKQIALHRTRISLLYIDLEHRTLLLTKLSINKRLIKHLLTKKH